MKKPAIALCLILTLLSLSFTPILAKQVDDPLDAISITPSVIRETATDGTITVQTNLKYFAAVPGSVNMTGLAPYLVTSNNRGYLVAKFLLSDVLSIVQPPSSYLSITIQRTDGSLFSAGQTVTVVESSMKPTGSSSDTSVNTLTYTYPSTTYTYPNSSYTYPQTTYTYPATTYTYPSTSYTVPQTAYTYPQATYTVPSTTYVNPVNPYVYSTNPYYP